MNNEAHSINSVALVAAFFTAPSNRLTQRALKHPRPPRDRSVQRFIKAGSNKFFPAAPAKRGAYKRGIFEVSRAGDLLRTRSRRAKRNAPISVTFLVTPPRYQVQRGTRGSIHPRFRRRSPISLSLSASAEKMPPFLVRAPISRRTREHTCRG